MNSSWGNKSSQVETSHLKTIAKTVKHSFEGRRLDQEDKVKNESKALPVRKWRSNHQGSWKRSNRWCSWSWYPDKEDEEVKEDENAEHCRFCPANQGRYDASISVTNPAIVVPTLIPNFRLQRKDTSLEPGDVNNAIEDEEKSISLIPLPNSYIFMLTIKDNSLRVMSI